MHRLTVLLLFVCIFTRTHATQAIANWDCVPFQVIDSVFNLGVVAFHEDGVEVEFYANGSLLERVTASTYNSRTDVYEYWTAFDPSGFPDGEVKLTAVAIPGGSGNENRVLDTLVLYANSGGNLSNATVKWADCDNGSDATGDGSQGNPYQTIEKAYSEVKAGGTVYLKASTNYYLLTSKITGNNYQYWTTVCPAPGLSRDDVTVLGSDSAGTSNGRFGENRIHWKDVRICCDNKPGYSSIFYFESGHHIWFEGVELFDKRGVTNGASLFGGNAGYRTYLTGCYVHDIMNVQAYPLLRDVNIHCVGADVYRGADNLTGINVSVDSTGVDAATTGAHPDFIQFYNPGDTAENIILYNNRCFNMDSQGLFGSDCRDFAVVNVLLEKDPPSSYATSQWSGVWDHILLWHMTTVDQGILARAPATNTNVDLRNCNLEWFSAGTTASLAGGSYSYNHYRTKTWDQPAFFGTDVTSGSQGFTDYDADDYTILDTSQCYRSGAYIPGVPADIDNVPYHPTTPNRGCFASGYVSDIIDLAAPALQAGGTTRYFDCAGRVTHGIPDRRGLYITEQGGVVRKVMVLE